MTGSIFTKIICYIMKMNNVNRQCSPFKVIVFDVITIKNVVHLVICIFGQWLTKQCEPWHLCRAAINSFLCLQPVFLRYHSCVAYCSSQLLQFFTFTFFGCPSFLLPFGIHCLAVLAILLTVECIISHFQSIWLGPVL